MRAPRTQQKPASPGHKAGQTWVKKAPRVRKQSTNPPPPLTSLLPWHPVCPPPQTNSPKSYPSLKGIWVTQKIMFSWGKQHSNKNSHVFKILLNSSSKESTSVTLPHVQRKIQRTYEYTHPSGHLKWICLLSAKLLSTHTCMPLDAICIFSDQESKIQEPLPSVFYNLKSCKIAQSWTKGKDNSNEGLMENSAPTILFIIGQIQSFPMFPDYWKGGRKEERKEKKRVSASERPWAHHQHHLLMNWPEVSNFTTYSSVSWSVQQQLTVLRTKWIALGIRWMVAILSQVNGSQHTWGPCIFHHYKSWS